MSIASIQYQVTALKADLLPGGGSRQWISMTGYTPAMKSEPARTGRGKLFDLLNDAGDKGMTMPALLDRLNISESRIRSLLHEFCVQKKVVKRHRLVRCPGRAPCHNDYCIVS
jgi:hypothetical protein